MRLLCLALIGAVNVFSVALAAPPDPSSTAPASAESAPSASLKAAVRQLWDASPEVSGARAELAAARARADAAARPLHNPTLSVEVENADVDRRTASLGLELDVFGKRRA